MKNLLFYLTIFFSSAVFSAMPNWEMYQANTDHTGYVDVSLDPASIRYLRSSSYGFVRPVILIEDKIILSGNNEENQKVLQALDIESGQLLWEKQFGQDLYIYPPAYGDGKVYLQTNSTATNKGYVRAYDIETGQFYFRMQYETQSDSHYAPTPYDGYVYMDGGRYGGVYAYDGKDGIEQWFQDLAVASYSTPAVNENYVFTYPDDDPHLAIIDRKTGIMSATIPDSEYDYVGSLETSPVLTDNNSVILRQGTRLVRFNLANKDISWAVNESFSTQPVYAHNIVYAINREGSNPPYRLEARNETTGALLWTWIAPNSERLMNAPVLTQNHVLVSTDESIYLININTHETEWTYPISGHLALGKDILAVSSSDGELVIFSCTAITEKAK